MYVPHKDFADGLVIIYILVPMAIVIKFNAYACLGYIIIMLMIAGSLVLTQAHCLSCFFRDHVYNELVNVTTIESQEDRREKAYEIMKVHMININIIIVIIEDVLVCELSSIRINT